jgi:hypothetical protein
MLPEHPPQTLLEMINVSLQLPELGNGNEAQVFPLAGLEIEYVLRERRNSPLKNLLHTTYLTQPKGGFYKLNLAPPLLEGEGFSIHPRQPGKSLRQHFAELTKKYHDEDGMSFDEAGAKAYTDLLRRMDALPQSVYETFLQDMNYLTSHRRGIDAYAGNVMMSESTLRWIDIGKKYENNHLEKVKVALFTPPLFCIINETEEMRQLKLQITEKLHAAAKVTHTPHDQEEAMAMMPAEHAFSHSQPITEIARVPLTATPAEVKKALSEIEQHIGKHF